jgi:hypothetical protein
MTDGLEVIAAFIDGERVDAEALKQALADPAGRDYLVDLVALRGVVRSNEPQYVRGAGPQSGRRMNARASLLRWAAAAVVVVALGGTWFLASKSSDRPPVPDRVVKLQRGLDWRGN